MSFTRHNLTLAAAALLGLAGVALGSWAGWTGWRLGHDAADVTASQVLIRSLLAIAMLGLAAHTADLALSLKSLPALLLLGLGLAMVLPAWRAWQTVSEMANLQTDTLIAGLAAGLGATVCFGGAIHYLDRPLSTPGTGHWYGRLALKLEKRLLLIAQLLTTAVVLGCIAALVLNLQVPGDILQWVSRAKGWK